MQEEAARMWRLRRWPNDPTVAHLIFVDHLSLPTPGSVMVAIEQARRTGASTVRTSALFPRVAEVLNSTGFETIDRLVLLRRQLDESVVSEPADLDHRTRPFRVWHLPRAARVDREAFGEMWGNDTASLREIRRATPHNRARLVHRGGDLAGFAISGAAQQNGYLQRLSVGTAYRRQHIASDLVLDALNWMHRCRLSAAFVNTAITNTAALHLYDSLGFEALDDELIIAERQLTG
jgi:ribosomal protein S18 acetylase RimI-like enzyme